MTHVVTQTVVWVAIGLRIGLICSRTFVRVAHQNNHRLLERVYLRRHAGLRKDPDKTRDGPESFTAFGLQQSGGMQGNSERRYGDLCQRRARGATPADHRPGM
jgi:hypothetical protein